MSGNIFKYGLFIFIGLWSLNLHAEDGGGFRFDTYGSAFVFGEKAITEEGVDAGLVDIDDYDEAVTVNYGDYKGVFSQARNRHIVDSLFHYAQLLSDSFNMQTIILDVYEISYYKKGFNDAYLEDYFERLKTIAFPNTSILFITNIKDLSDKTIDYKVRVNYVETTGALDNPVVAAEVKATQEKWEQIEAYTETKKNTDSSKDSKSTLHNEVDILRTTLSGSELSGGELQDGLCQAIQGGIDTRVGDINLGSQTTRWQFSINKNIQEINANDEAYIQELQRHVEFYLGEFVVAACQGDDCPEVLLTTRVNDGTSSSQTQTVVCNEAGNLSTIDDTRAFYHIELVCVVTQLTGDQEYRLTWGMRVDYYDENGDQQPENACINNFRNLEELCNNYFENYIIEGVSVQSTNHNFQSDNELKK